MRLYDFECSACGKVFEDLVHDVSDARCPKCGTADVVKQLSTFAAVGSRSEGCEARAAGGGCGAGACGGGGCALN